MRKLVTREEALYRFYDFKRSAEWDGGDRMIGDIVIGSGKVSLLPSAPRRRRDVGAELASYVTPEGGTRAIHLAFATENGFVDGRRRLADKISIQIRATDASPRDRARASFLSSSPRSRESLGETTRMTELIGLSVSPDPFREAATMRVRS